MPDSSWGLPHANLLFHLASVFGNTHLSVFLSLGLYLIQFSVMLTSETDTKNSALIFLKLNFLYPSEVGILFSSKSWSSFLLHTKSGNTLAKHSAQGIDLLVLLTADSLKRPLKYPVGQAKPSSLPSAVKRAPSWHNLSVSQRGASRMDMYKA